MIWQLFLLLPDPAAVAIFSYVVGVVLWHFEGRIQIHGGVLMSNHLHLVVFDRDAERTDLLNRLYSVLARAINRLRERKGRLFDLPSHKDKRAILDPEGALRALVYLICNPVQAGVVEWPHEWPGSLGDWRQILTVPIAVTKPLQFFSQRSSAEGGMPDEVCYYLTKLPCFEHLEDAEYEALIRERVEEECLRIHAERGAPVLGVPAALSHPVHHRPEEPDREVAHPEHRFYCEPERAQEFLDLWIEWVALYFEVRDRWIAGHREGVEFPPGTDAYHRLEDAPRGELEPGDPFAWLFPP